MKYNLKNRPKWENIAVEVFADECEAWFVGFERKHRKMDFSEWIQEHQEEVPLGYSKAQLLGLYVKREVLGE